MIINCNNINNRHQTVREHVNVPLNYLNINLKSQRVFF